MLRLGCVFIEILNFALAGFTTRDL